MTCLLTSYLCTYPSYPLYPWIFVRTPLPLNPICTPPSPLPYPIGSPRRGSDYIVGSGESGEVPDGVRRPPVSWTTGPRGSRGSNDRKSGFPGVGWSV